MAAPATVVPICCPAAPPSTLTLPATPQVVLNKPGPDAKVEDQEFEPNEVYAIDIVVSSGEAEQSGRWEVGGAGGVQLAWVTKGHTATRQRV